MYHDENNSAGMHVLILYYMYIKSNIFQWPSVEFQIFFSLYSLSFHESNFKIRLWVSMLQLSKSMMKKELPHVKNTDLCTWILSSSVNFSSRKTQEKKLKNM